MNFKVRTRIHLHKHIHHLTFCLYFLASLDKSQETAVTQEAAAREAHTSNAALKAKLRKSRRSRRSRHGDHTEEDNPDEPAPTPASDYANGVVLSLPDWAPKAGDESIPRPKGSAGNTYKLIEKMGFKRDTRSYYNRIRVCFFLAFI